MRLQLFVLACNLGNVLRQAVLPQAVRHWTLTTLREKLMGTSGNSQPVVDRLTESAYSKQPVTGGSLIKIGAKVVRHARQVIFQMAEVAIPRELFRAILEGIQRLRLPTLLTG